MYYRSRTLSFSCLILHEVDAGTTPLDFPSLCGVDVMCVMYNNPSD
ncbi:hypothetical protein LINPERPRIM_LOCUS40472, partial [Linum perenne]